MKTDRIGKEFEDKRLNIKLFAILIDAYGFVRAKYGKSTNLRITEIWRSEEEQESIYGKDSRRSLHQEWCAVDFAIITQSEKEDIMKIYYELKNYINSRWTYYGSDGIQTAVAHDVKNQKGELLGFHIHIQAGWADPTR